MENDDFLKELEQMTNSLDKDYSQIINSDNNTIQKKNSLEANSNTNMINPTDKKIEAENKQENPFFNNSNNLNNPFGNFGNMFANPNMNPEDCFKELQKLMESDLGGPDDNDLESKEMFNLLGIKILINKFIIY
jgi:hypothetical protein